jgi:hypothetical protein
MEYKVIVSWDIDSFEKEISNFLKQNWELVGGVSTSYNRPQFKFQYSQAMVKKIK